MFSALRAILARLFSPPVATKEAEGALSTSRARGGAFIPYDENLLEKLRGYWVQGNWNALIDTPFESFAHHPERAKLALLVAAGHQQLRNPDQAKQLLRHAQDWGCTKRLISQVLISGVYNNIACASAVAGQQRRSLKHFQQSLALVQTNNEDVAAQLEARIEYQLSLVSYPSLANISTHFPALNVAAEANKKLARGNALLIGELDSLNNGIETGITKLIERLDQLPVPLGEQGVKLPANEQRALSGFLQHAMAQRVQEQ